MLNSKINILFTSSGRRLSLLQQFRKVLVQHNLNGSIMTADLKQTAPTAFFSDKHFIVPRVTDPNYIPKLLQICQKEKIDIIIPLIDTELVILSENRHAFEEIGVKLLVSSNELNEISCDKTKAYKYFQDRNISTPKVFSDDEINNKQYQFPLLIKPLNGSSSVGVTKINNEKELYFFKDYIPNAMVQEFVTGTEYTVDVMVDFNGNIKTVVPRLRLETRAGEVSKGVTKKDSDIITAVKQVVKSLPGPVGCITLQCFKKENGEITFIEINPRFGGGIPLSIEAGADFPLWVLQMCSGESFSEEDYNWRENLTMLRYDEAVFTESIQHDH
ncbi:MULTISPECIES: ATP-grasp domain-containing protein [unclassified Paenibacillus]|uniref:ATP-grasp domain-containing protein n=1 Tax=unclassified Paenibacillus TaxID=185978 RepID=UPI00278AB902|nr:MULTISPECIES: ATP-grasp domain-containing protein [unclassified Paenibacillus]MDQ0903986.1 carbamoyl-phosphate synthase large subunit [Paenibacillus sp. V4I7]MDQ0917480.1 carbamoyl-phosphate synthase large subunit [Paenibacillus sp. V4I5]